MSPVIETNQTAKRPVVYLLHHGVIKEASTSTKLRAVFDASSKTSSGKSLNDILPVGRTIQRNLIDIVIRFRCYNVALTGDIQKMYRQIAEGYKYELPVASRALTDQIYVDDILAGADNAEDAILLREQLTAILKSGGFQAHKWCSNCTEVLKKIPPHLREDMSNLSIDSNNTIKTLGIEWRPKDDQFQFCVHGMEAAKTKREILSAISKLFDPLGLIGPVITTAKIIMQATWRTECRWDESLPDNIVEKWEQFQKDLSIAVTVLIPRQIIPSETVTNIYLQGFCDASENAYGACLYVQTRNERGVLEFRLLCSKSRVAPIKPTSIPDWSCAARFFSLI
ncbi:uncharacterized protein [Polyergus mexicanus]|uniref:uncharacterized protein n=1 Tax=Polyergus mexicanus TaxID=615972 RepID=UPI0038B5F678